MTHVSQVHGAVKVSKRDKVSVTLEWKSNPVNDMIADSLMALIMNIEANPGQDLQMHLRLQQLHHFYFFISGLVVFLLLPFFAGAAKAIGKVGCGHTHNHNCVDNEHRKAGSETLNLFLTPNK